MAEDKPTTPEQQLLKLIEGQGKVDAPGGPSGAGVPARGPKGRGRASLGGLRTSFLASISFWKRKAGKKPRSARPGAVFGIAEVNKVLAVATLMLLVYVAFDAAASARSLQKPPDFAPMKDIRPAVQKEPVAALPETSYYLQKISSRDIFREGKKVEEYHEEAPVASVPTEDAEAVRSLALVGISWSSNPDAIVEDKSKQRTYFVKRGQEVGDGVRVEAIFKDHVIVTYEDREYELR